jgi:hypothetical protein
VLTLVRTLAINFIKVNLCVPLVSPKTKSTGILYDSLIFIKLCLLSIIIISLMAIMLKDNPTRAVMVIELASLDSYLKSAGSFYNLTS